jgi:hypothetical protein
MTISYINIHQLYKQHVFLENTLFSAGKYASMKPKITMWR